MIAQISALDPPRGEVRIKNVPKSALFCVLEIEIEKSVFFGTVTRGDILMQGRHSSNVGPRGLQPASNTVPPSLPGFT